MQIENNPSQILAKIQQDLQEIQKIEHGKPMPGSQEELQFKQRQLSDEINQLSQHLPKEGQIRDAFNRLQHDLGSINWSQKEGFQKIQKDVSNVQNALILNSGNLAPISPGLLGPGGTQPILGPGGEPPILGPGGLPPEEHPNPPGPYPEPLPPNEPGPRAPR